MLTDIDFDVSTAPLSPVDVPMDVFHRITQFLYHEARLLDADRLDEWLDLWTDDGMYWMPAARGQANPYDHVSLIWEDRTLRDVRVRRLKSAEAWSQQPTTQTSRIVGNVVVDGADVHGRLVVSSAFQLTEWRTSKRQLAGRYLHLLQPDGDGWKIHLKRVDLVDVDGAQEVFEMFA